VFIVLILTYKWGASSSKFCVFQTKLTDRLKFQGRVASCGPVLDTALLQDIDMALATCLLLKSAKKNKNGYLR